MNNEAILLVPPTVIEVVSIVFNGARFSRWYLHLYHAALILVLMMSVQGEFEVDELPTCFGSFFHTVKLSWL